MAPNDTIRNADDSQGQFQEHRLPEDRPSTFEVTRQSLDTSNLIWRKIEDDACRVIFGSNFIEDAGAGFGYTSKLCKKIFHGEHVDVEVAEADQDSPEHAMLLSDLRGRGKLPDESTVIRARREIIQHAQALVWAVNHTCFGEKAWTERSVKTVHAILYAGMANDEVTPGEYRGAGHCTPAQDIDPNTGRVTRLIHHEVVRAYMVDWVYHLSSDMLKTERGSEPHILAAKHYHHFINIEPFGDGTGRVARIILSTLAMQLCNCLLPLGEYAKEKHAYLDIAVRGSRGYQSEEAVPMDEQIGHLEMAELIATKIEQVHKRRLVNSRSPNQISDEPEEPADFWGWFTWATRHHGEYDETENYETKKKTKGDRKGKSRAV
ncbi:hypothetical protein F4802DRAFT_137348 [Xylaria palmicola]|nr:hypothetical protein F4802DRAFT_137348 [Xylaria palmicola]